MADVTEFTPGAWSGPHEVGGCLVQAHGSIISFTTQAEPDGEVRGIALNPGDTYQFPVGSTSIFVKAQSPAVAHLSVEIVAEGE